MYKSLKRIVLLLVFVCVTLGLSVFALACNPEQPKDNGPEISAEYQALYEQYKEAAGENAKTLQDWYEALSADIEGIGDMGDIADMDVLEIENVQYVALTYENGRLFLEELLNGESFKEYSVFTLSPNAADQATITGIYLDVNRKGANGALEKVRSVRTGADGKVSVYLEVDGQATYVVTIGEQSAETYGFALGYEPQFSGSQETKTVAFSVQTASEKITYSAKVVYRADDYAPTKDVKLSLRYVESDKASLKVVGEGTTDEDGRVEISFYAHENSKYEFVLDEASLTPDKYDPVEGPIEVDPEVEETVFTLIRLKNYDEPDVLEPSGTPKKAEDIEDKEWIAVTVPTTGELETLFQYNSETDTYNYTNSADSANSGKQLYVALDLFLARVHAEKTIKQLLDEGGYFTFEECIEEDQNTWAFHDYSEVLKAYMEYKSEKGVYPLNKDLYNFITSAAANGLFAQKANDSKYDLFMPLMVESAPRLIVGKEFTTTLRACDDNYYWQGNYAIPRTAVPLMSDMEEGWYKLKVKSSGFQKTNDPKKMLGKYARLGGYTRDKNGLFTFGRFFTLDMKSEPGTTSNVDFEGIIYVGAGDKEIVIMCGAYDYYVTYNLTLNLSKITAEDATLSTLVGKKQQLLSPEKSEYEVLVYPENGLLEQHTDAKDTNEKQYLKSYTNIPTYGYTFDMSRMFVKYTITPTVEGIEGLKIHKYNYSYSESTKSMGSKTEPVTSVSFSYTAGTAIEGETTKLDVDAFSSSANSTIYGVVFTHSGTGIKTMKIKLEATKTRYTVTYSAGEGVGEDYTEGSGTTFYNVKTYYAEGSQVNMLDNAHSKLEYTREGYIFDGWSYENAEGETVKVKPGDKVPMLDHDMVFTAVWREANVNSKDLAVSEEVEVEFDSETYTSVEINLADTVEENKGYTLTITMGEEEWASGLLLVLGDYNIYPIESESSDDAHAYVAYFIKWGESDKILIDLTKLSVNFTATFALEEYTPVVLKADGNEIIVPIYDDAFVEKSLFEPDREIVDVLYVALDESMTAPSTYSFAKGDAVPSYSSVNLRGYLGPDDFGGITYHGGRNFSSYNEAYVIMAEGLTKIHFVKGMVYSERFFGAGKITITNLYSVTYKSTQEDVDGKNAPATPSSDSSVYADGKNVTLQTPGDIRDAYAFDYWTVEGDSSDTHYLGGSQYEIHKNTTFVAHWKQLNKMQVRVDFNKGASGTGDIKLNIDPDTNTHCEIILENISNLTYGLIVTLDLGTSSFNKEIPMKIGTTNAIFTHSDALSSDGHNFYSAAYRDSRNSTTVTLTLDLDAWKTAGNPVLSDIGVAASRRTSVGKVGSFSAYGVYFAKKDDGKLWANGSLNANVNAGGEDFGYGLPTTVPKGYTYDVHVKFHIDDPKTTIGSSITLKLNASSKLAMNYNESSKEYTYNGWDSSTNSFFMLESRSIKDGLTCDVWLEQAAGGYTLSLEKTADSVKITKDAPATIYLEETVLQSANDMYVITVTGATDKITLKFTDSSSSPVTANLESANSYTAKRITFGTVKLTLSTEAEQTVTVKLTKFDSENSKVFNAGGENVYSLGADKAVIDFDCGFLAASSTSYYKVKLTTKDGGALDESAVIKFRVILLTGTSQEYTFNQANGFIVDVVTLPIEKMCYYELWSENGAIEIKMAFEKYAGKISTVGNKRNGYVDYEFKNVDDSVEIVIVESSTLTYNTEYCVNLLLPAANADCEFEITCGNKTITLKGDASSTTLTTTEKVTFAEAYRILKVTAKAGITDSTSIRIYLTAPTV